MKPTPRLEAARKRVRIARYVIGAAAAGALAGGAVVARAAHPGSHGHRSTTAQAAIPSESSAFQSAAGDSGVLDSSSGGSVSAAPQASAPVVQSSGS